jgi:hypothetical protein
VCISFIAKRLNVALVLHPGLTSHHLPNHQHLAKHGLHDGVGEDVTFGGVINSKATVYSIFLILLASGN